MFKIFVLTEKVFSSNISVAVFHIERVLQSEIMTVFYQRSRPFFQSAPSPNMDEQFEHVVRVESCHKLKGLESSKQERVSSMIHYFAQMLTLKRVDISRANFFRGNVFLLLKNGKINTAWCTLLVPLLVLLSKALLGNSTSKSIE